MTNRVKTLYTTEYLKLMFGVTGLGGVIGAYGAKNAKIKFNQA